MERQLFKVRLLSQRSDLYVTDQLPQIHEEANEKIRLEKTSTFTSYGPD